MSHRAQVRCLTELARTALAAYPLSEPRLRLQAHLFNTTFRVFAPGGEQYLLRLPRPSLTSVEAARSELLWLRALRQETSLQVPEPVPNNEQNLVTAASCPGMPEPRLCVLFRWIEGRFLYKSLTPSHLLQVGDLMAHLQDHAAHWQRPGGFTRGRVDNLDPLRRGSDDGFDAAIAEGVIRTVAAVSTPEAAAVLEAAIRKVWPAMRALGQGRENQRPSAERRPLLPVVPSLA